MDRLLAEEWMNGLPFRVRKGGFEEAEMDVKADAAKESAASINLH